jgi:hypothetical protein
VNEEAKARVGLHRHINKSKNATIVQDHFFSCLNDKHPADVCLAFQISVVLTVDEGSEKKNTCDNKLQKVYQKPSVLQQMLKTLPT